jgi:hypothetical protein
MFRKTKATIYPLTFNGYNPRLILKISEMAQKELLKETPSGEFPIPFFNKSEVGCNANFKCKKMADKVTELLEKVVSHDFPESNIRLVFNLFYHCIEEDEENFIFFFDEKTFFILHLDEGIANKTIEKMTQMMEKYMIPYPVVLLTELFQSCPVKLAEDDMLLISCGMQTFLKPIYAKEAQFTKAFSKTLERITKQKIVCTGMDFYDVKNICKEIDIKGVYFYITSEYVELSGLPFNVKNFSEILKRRLKDHTTEARVLSRK